jgi:hypothetical protein
LPPRQSRVLRRSDVCGKPAAKGLASPPQTLHFLVGEPV